MPTFFSHLECSVPCGAGPYDPRQPRSVCTCGAPLLARYNLTGAKRWPKSELTGREATIWRYREILPLLESDKGIDLPVTLGEGWTPLLRARRLGKTLGVDRLFVKDEATNPTGSSEARGLSAAITRALHVGLRTVGIAGGQTDAIAACAYAARAGLDARAFLAKDARPQTAALCQFYGAKVTPVEGTADAARQAAADQSAADGGGDLTAFREPYRLEGKKSLGYELAEQLSWQLPDWIIHPTGSGAGIVAIWKALAEMAALGWIDAVRRPHLLAVQASGCAPIVRAFGANAEKASTWDNPDTIAEGLRVASSPGDFLVLRALRESAGSAVAVGDAEMTAGMKELARHEGVSASFEGGAGVHALRLMLADGRIKPHDTVVIVNTGMAPALTLKKR